MSTPDGMYAQGGIEGYKKEKKRLIDQSLKEIRPNLSPTESLERVETKVAMADKNSKRFISPEDLELMVRQAGGNLTRCAEACGVTRGTIVNWLEKDGNTGLVKSLQDEKVDAAEDVLHKKIVEEENLDATKFFLSTVGKDRGYFTKQEKEVNTTIRVNLEAPLPPTQEQQQVKMTDEEYEERRAKGEQ